MYVMSGVVGSRIYEMISGCTDVGQEWRWVRGIDIWGGVWLVVMVVVVVVAVVM